MNEKQMKIENNQIPTNWSLCKLGDILTIKTGRKDANYGTENGEYVFYLCRFIILCKGNGVSYNGVRKRYWRDRNAV